jgi:hypothetical protein
VAKFVKGQISWNKGIPHSKESNEKNRQSHLGKGHTEEAKQKISQSLKKIDSPTRFSKGQDAWNKGKKNPRFTLEEIKEHQKEWRQKNKEKIYANNQKWRLANKDKQKEYAKKCRINNSARVNANVNKRRADKLNRTPKWLTKDDLWLIKEAYELSVLRTKLFGFKWHVDHIIPLKGKTVSGLHVPNNLQVIEGKLNIMKNNKFEGELS